MLETLGIIPIVARSPQAKGRVERLFGTLQDRLVAHLQQAGITDLAAANAALPAFLQDFNARFAVPATAPPAWRPAPEALEDVLAFRYPATVGKDHVVRCGGERFAVPALPGGRSRAGRRVEVRQLLDGRWRVYDGTTLLTETAATPLGEPLRTRARRPGPPPTVDDAAWVPDDSLEALGNLTLEELDPLLTRWRTRPGHGVEVTRLA